MRIPRPTLTLLLDAEPDAPARARAAVAAHVDDPEARADLELAASELVTNAVSDGPGDPGALILLDLEVEPGSYALTISSSRAADVRRTRPGEELGLSMLRALGCRVEIRHEEHRTIASCHLPRTDGAQRAERPAV